MSDTFSKTAIENIEEKRIAPPIRFTPKKHRIRARYDSDTKRYVLI